jgi:hypothetical protein
MKGQFVRTATAANGGWSPFDKHGQLKVVLATDPWWKRALAHIRREPIWHQLGALSEDGIK